MTLSVIRTKIDQIDVELIRTLSDFFVWLKSLEQFPTNLQLEVDFPTYALSFNEDGYPDLEKEFKIIFWTLIQGQAADLGLPLKQACVTSKFAKWHHRLMYQLNLRASRALEVEAYRRQNQQPILNRYREEYAIKAAIDNARKFSVSGNELPPSFVVSIMMSLVNYCTKIEVAQREAG